MFFFTKTKWYLKCFKGFAFTNGLLFIYSALVWSLVTLKGLSIVKVKGFPYLLHGSIILLIDVIAITLNIYADRLNH